MRICAICGKKIIDKDIKILGYSQGMAGVDLGDVCNECIRHIQQCKCFIPVKEETPIGKENIGVEDNG